MNGPSKNISHESKQEARLALQQLENSYLSLFMSGVFA